MTNHKYRSLTLFIIEGREKIIYQSKIINKSFLLFALMQGNDPYNRCKSHRADNSEHINFYDRCLGEFVPEKKSIIFYRNYFVPGQTSYAIGLEKISKY